MSDEKSERSSLLDRRQERWERWGRWGWWLFAAVALFYLLTEHQAHLFGVLPYVLLLACPLMHFLMHGKHGGHGLHEPPGAQHPVANPNPEEARHEPR